MISMNYLGIKFVIVYSENDEIPMMDRNIFHSFTENKKCDTMLYCLNKRIISIVVLKGKTYYDEKRISQ